MIKKKQKKKHKGGNRRLKKSCNFYWMNQDWIIQKFKDEQGVLHGKELNDMPINAFQSLKRE